MGVIVRAPGGKLSLIIKGADSALLPLCRYAAFCARAHATRREPLRLSVHLWRRGVGNKCSLACEHGECTSHLKVHGGFARICG